MARITWLANVLRSAGLSVVEHSGWQTRERPGDWTPQFGIVHATAAPRGQADATQVAIVRDGRSDLRGPIANACVTRDGTWHVLAAGRCNTTLAGTAGPYAGKGNAYALGVEACNDNLAEAWPAGQYEAYARGWAAICRQLDWTPDRLRGHKEHTPGHKTDPTFDMPKFRAHVQTLLQWRPDMGVDLTPYWGDRVHATLGNTWTLLERLAAEDAETDQSHVLLEQIKTAVEQLAQPAVDVDALASALAGHAGFVDALAVAVVEKLGDTIPTLEDLERVTRDEMLAALRGTRLNPDS
jgi:hypothetical protein